MNPVRINVHETAGLARAAAAIRIGVPLARGALFDAAAARLSGSEGAVPTQCRALALWSDGSIKWLLVDGLLAIGTREQTTLMLDCEERASAAPSVPVISTTETPNGVVVSTGAATVRFLRDTSGVPASVVVGGHEVLAANGSAVRIFDAQGREHRVRFESVRVEETGPVRAVIVSDGACSGAAPHLDALRFQARVTLTAGSAALTVDLKIHNPRAAQHLGGTWDLGDAGSVVFRELALSLRPVEAARSIRWYADPGEPAVEQPSGKWTLYQDSSGGENWSSENHVDAAGRSTVSWRGYRVTGGGNERNVTGNRATPALLAAGESAWIAASVRDFWQNFPKALRWEDDELKIVLFPRESVAPFELQGGEQKRHSIVLDFGVGLPAAQSFGEVRSLQQPLAVWVDPRDVESSGAVSYFVAGFEDRHRRFADYLQQIVEGPRSFAARRELIDEYGWRNFGDIYADHEAVNHTGPRPMVSHYNNQYDFVYGAFVQFLRSGDMRWRSLMEDAARHHIDIDVYRTTQDRAAFNGGLFWHTDHYKPANTCSHRTYSRSNGALGSYGGGPSNEHNYTSGFLHYYYLTGDPEAAGTVTLLADWVLALDDGENDLLGVLDCGETGRASQTVVPEFHKPGRGAGNSINALLDAWSLTGERRYMAKAEQLIQRCIHPVDDVGALGLDRPEHRWSYLVFLQVLSKYLDTKLELGEIDYCFHYARASLLLYADWMLVNERPYKEWLDRVELPTETWPAHDIRKCHVLNAAAKYAPAVNRERLRERAAFFFDRCIEDLLSFETSWLARPLIILSVYGHVQAYFEKAAPAPREWKHVYRFGQPQVFVPQRQRIKATVARKSALLARELARIGRDKFYLLKRRLTG